MAKTITQLMRGGQYEDKQDTTKGPDPEANSKRTTKVHDTEPQPVKELEETTAEHHQAKADHHKKMHEHHKGIAEEHQKMHKHHKEMAKKY